MKSIYLRNFVAIAALVSICFLVIALSFVGIGRQYMISEFSKNMERSAAEVAHTTAAVAQSDELDSWVLRMNVCSVASAGGNQIFLADPEGLVLCCSDRDPRCEHIGMVVPASILEQTEEGTLPRRSDLGGLFKARRYVAARPIYAAGEELLGYVFVSNQAGNMLGAWSTFLTAASGIAVVVFGIALAVTMIYTRHMARPLDEMAAASRKFARGDFSVRVKQTEDPTDEMGALIESFNKMADSLEQAEKRRSEFIANISHELRTPMTTISGFADGILDGTIPRDQEDKYLRSIRDETRRLSRLVREMLTVSQARAKAANPSTRTNFDLTELVLQILLSFESRATKKNLDVDPQLPDDHLMVRADKDAITQVIYNLLDNAVKFASPDSCLVVKLYKDDGKVYVSVKDRGETIPPEDLPFIFDRFHKSDRSRSLDKDGVGLGLYLVKTILNSHDEDIAVKSQDGETEFVFTLPLAT
ncbi:MAG: HAMP domain-containing histidine kinase [Oscillospiraceae bacterium]|nr:HAMP domain-containing histidine kinase [Oscillospiraceae bacterium]